MELLTINLAAGETQAFRLAGRYFEVIDAQGRLDVFFEGREGERGDDMIGALSGFWAGVPFFAFSIRNAEAVAQTVTVLHSSHPGGSRRTPGTVQVVDANRAVTVQGRSFVAVNNQFASAGNLNVNGIFNASSGTRLIVRRVEFGSATPSLFSLQDHNAVVGAANFNCRNKLLGGAASAAAQMCFNAQPVSFGTTIFISRGSFYEPKTPIVIMPGRALYAVNNTANADFITSIDFDEEPLSSS